MKNWKFLAMLTVIALASAVTMAPAGTEVITELLRTVIGASANDDAIRIEYSPTSAVTSSSTKTNTVQEVLTLEHQTSGTPANGIGAGLGFEQETTDANIENVMNLDTVMSDVTAGSEDASFSLKLMAAGAEPAEKFSVTSTGVVSLVNAETIDNTVNGTITYTATTHAFAGAQTLSGNLDVDTDVLSVDATADTVSTSGDLSVTGDVSVGGWAVFPTTTVAAAAYTATSTGKAMSYVIDYTATGAVQFFLPDSADDGTIISLKDIETASANNIVVYPYGGSGDTVEGGASYTMDADKESTVFQYHLASTDWLAIAAFKE